MESDQEEQTLTSGEAVDFGNQDGDVLLRNLVRREFAINLAVKNFDDKARFAETAGNDIGRRLIDDNGRAGNIRAQNADIGISGSELID